MKTQKNYPHLIFEPKELYDRFLEYFDVRELVSDEAWDAYSHKGSYFFLSHFDPRLLIAMLWIRETLGRKITVNDWLWGGGFSQRGLRDNLQNIIKSVTARGVVYLSGHPLAMALDFDVDGMQAFEVRNWLVDNAASCPFPIRLENLKDGKQINWVHLDVKYDPKNSRVYLFNI